MKVKKRIFFQAFITLIILAGFFLVLGKTTKVLFKEFVKPTPEFKALTF